MRQAQTAILERRALDAVLRSSFPAFLQKVFHTLCPGQEFEGGWPIDAMSYQIARILSGEERRLIVNLPPRSLKSIAFSVALPAYALGLNPRRRIICVSYSGELAKKLSNQFRAIIESDWYRRLFPRTRIGPFKNTETEIEFTEGGFRLAVSVHGTLTGRGGDLIIIDDPIKPEDALSLTIRTGTNQWFFNTLLSRQDNKLTGAILVVMQRLHVDDLTGCLLEGPEAWIVLRLPAIAEERELILIGNGRHHERLPGDVLCPVREPRHALETLRRQLGSDIFSAQYLQAPVPPGGAMIKCYWVQRYSHLPDRSWQSRVVQSWDTANKGGAENDLSVCTTWLIDNGQFYLLDVERGRYDYPQLKQRALFLADLHRPDSILVEDTNTGSALIQELCRAGRPAIGVRPEGDKIARMSVQSAKFEAGLVHLPERAAWLADFEAELFAFPGSRHDDQIDSVSQALAHYSGGYRLLEVL
jgi:predicted phage terminase large subunit-like protein